MDNGINTIKEEPESNSQEEGDDTDGCFDQIEFDSSLFKKELGLNESTIEKNKCHYCGLVFQYASALNRHIVTHTKSKAFSCEVCGNRFGTNNHRLRHLRQVHKLETSVASSSAKTALRCSHCAAFSCASAGALRRHVLLKHCGEEERPFACHNCGKSFLSAAHLRRHARAHAQIRTHVCPWDGFVEKSNLQAHLRVHTEEAPFACGHCGKRFRASTTRTHHEMIHTGERRHACADCGKTFIAKTTLSRHVSAVHRGKRPFRCLRCGSRFASRAHLKRHSAARHANANEPTDSQAIKSL